MKRTPLALKNDESDDSVIASYPHVPSRHSTLISS